MGKAFEGSIDYLQIMDENGNVDKSLVPPDLSDDKIVEMYRNMCFARTLDAKMLSLQREGRAATYAPLVGEEATQIGSAMAMRSNDYFVPNFRQHGVFLVRGYPLENFITYWKGFEDGSRGLKEIKSLDVAVPVGTQMPHAAGLAFAMKYKGADSAVVSYVGDGGTSEGDFYEAMNFAGVYKLRLVIIIENNQWAISVPRKKQTAAETLAQKAIAAGIKGIQVDGNDVIAVYKATKDALANAKDGPTLIECVTYRMSMHTTSDDPTKYRSEEEVNAWKAKDPIKRVKLYLMGKNLWNDELESKMNAEHESAIDAAVEKVEKEFRPDPKSMYKNIYSFMPDVLNNELNDALSENFWKE